MRSIQRSEKNQKDNENNTKCYNRKCIATFILTDSKAEMNLFKINRGTSFQIHPELKSFFWDLTKKEHNLSSSVYLDLYCYLLNIPNCSGKPSKVTCLQQETCFLKSLTNLQSFENLSALRYFKKDKFVNHLVMLQFNISSGIKP